MSIRLWGMVVLASSVLGLSTYDYLEVVKNFADNLLAPKNIAVVQSINREYLFGLFVNTARDPTDPSPFGSPIAYNITATAVQHNTVAASIKFEYYYGSLNRTFPIQLGNIMLTGSRYDVSLRRWAWAADYITPQLIPHMAQRAKGDSTNATLILQQYLAQSVCDATVIYCNGSNQQYDSYDTCMDFVTSVPIGQAYRAGENNLVCRHLHVPMAPLRPTVHCPHLGLTGGGMCIDRTSADPKGLQLGRIRFSLPGGIRSSQICHSGEPGRSGESGEISLSQLDEHTWDPTFYPIAVFGYMLLYYVAAKVIYRFYTLKNGVFEQLSLQNQQNVVVYTLSFIVTTIALGLQLAATPAFAGHYSLTGVGSLRTAGTLISSLYCFELVYRLHMRLPVIAHHFLTILAISLSWTLFENTQSMSFYVSAIIWLFYATTDQLTFVGLLGYRLEWPVQHTAFLLQIAAVQSLVIKAVSTLSLPVYWAVKQKTIYRPIDAVWAVSLWVVACALLLIQLWASFATWTISHSALSRPRGHVHLADD
ncbi:hypothetical protein M231_00018 [Tremella mesenterica]|uniref:DUF3533 domain-containing protein n=1 Tax=Tremella mesenterica TaxID=5217 RepID=A0A4Q1BWB8_TREME|nr:hypothetical protein M231_00018 [Tremella mesenterica]